MGTIHQLHVVTKKVDADSILELAKGKLDEVLVIGWGKDGVLYAAASSPNLAENYLLAEHFQQAVLNNDFEG